MRLVIVRVVAVCALVGIYALSAPAGIAMLVAGFAYTIYQHQRASRSHAG
jgi:hypothetical protein